MKVYVNDKDNNLVISISGSINTDTVTNLRSEVEAINFDSFDSVELDFKNVDYISSAGLRLLISLKKSLSEKGKTLEVHSLNDVCKEVFKVTGFNNVLTVK